MKLSKQQYKYPTSLILQVITVCLSSLFGQSSSLVDHEFRYFNPDGNRYGILDRLTGEPVTGLDFDLVNKMLGSDTLLEIRKNGKQGLYSCAGRMIIPIEFDAVVNDLNPFFRLGFVIVKNDEKFGLFNTKKAKQVLSPIFERVGAFSADRVFGCRDGKVEVFDAEGTKVFEAKGKSAFSVAANSWTIFVLGDGAAAQSFDENGKPQPTGFCFTDNLVSVFWKLNENGQSSSATIVNSAGKVLLEDATRIFMLAERRYLIVNDFQRTVGICDELGKWIVSPSKRASNRIGDPSNFSNAIVFHDPATKTDQVFDATGKLLVDACEVEKGSVDFNQSIARRMGGFDPNDYFFASKKDQKNQKGLFAADGRNILPMQFNRIRLASSWHPAIAMSEDKLGRRTENAYDLKDGRKLFAKDFAGLGFTLDPRVFLAFSDGKWALVKQKTTDFETPVFEFSTFTVLKSAYLGAQKDKKMATF